MDDLTVASATGLSTEDLLAIGRLMAELTDQQQTIADQALLEQIINSDSHVLLLARMAGEIVGMATLGLLVGPAAGRKIYLDDFVANPNVQGKGVGSKLWRAMLDWGRQHGATKLEFTSRASRQAAHQFYLAKGATIRDTDVFSVEL